MFDRRNSHRTAVALFAVAVIIAIIAAFVTTLERVDTMRLATIALPAPRASPSHARHSIERQAGQATERPYIKPTSSRMSLGPAACTRGGAS